MKYNNVIKLFIVSMLFLNNTVFNKAAAQTKISDAFTGAVKRDVLPSELPEVTSKFNPTTTSKSNSTYSPDGITTITDGQDVRVFPSPNVQAEVHISVNKLNSNNLLASANTYLNTYNQGYYYSFDGGNTWNGADQLQNNPGQLFGDPSTAFSADGRAHITTIDPAGGYLTQNSTNGGATWSNLINGTTQASFDKEMVAADNSSTSPFVNNVYCAWSILQSTTGPYFVNFNRSTNGGASFTAPITLKPNNGMGQGANVQTGPNGEVYVCWADYDVDGTNKVTYPSHGLGFCRSTDGGVNFTAYQRVLNYTGIRASGSTDPLFNNIGINDFPSMAVDKSNGPHRGRIYVVIPIKENGNGKSVVAFTFSDNQGVTWTTPTTISISIGRQNFFPWITVDDCTGDVWVTYYSFDTSSGFTTNTYVAHSVDGGGTWESQKVSDVGHTTAPINNAIFRAGYAGDYIGITAFGGKAFPIWMDNRNGTWQLYCSPITSNLSALSISGDASFCTTSKLYTIPGLPAGATVSWDASPYGIVTINNPNSPSTTLTTQGSGIITLTATISNVCGGSQIIITKQPITVGDQLTGTITQGGNNIPMLTYNSIAAGPTSVTFQWPGVSGISCYQSSSNPSVSQTGFIYYPSQSKFWFTLSKGQSITVSFSGTGCGGATVATRSFSVSGYYYIISPNPASGTVNIKPNSSSSNVKTESLKVGTNIQVSITDVNGSIKKQQQFSGSTTNMQLNVANLIPGTYFVHIINGNINETQQLIINR